MRAPLISLTPASTSSGDLVAEPGDLFTLVKKTKTIATYAYDGAGMPTDGVVCMVARRARLRAMDEAHRVRRGVHVGPIRLGLFHTQFRCELADEAERLAYELETIPSDVRADTSYDGYQLWFEVWDIGRRLKRMEDS